MPKITPKSPELLQAQVVAFTVECISRPLDTGHIINNLGSIAAGGLIDIEKVPSEIEYADDENDDLAILPEDVTKPVIAASEYIDFLRSVGGSRDEVIQYRADMLVRYNEEFRPVVSKLRDDLSATSEPGSHPDFVGSGYNSAVFRVHHGDTEFAVRIPDKGHLCRGVVVDSHLTGAALGRGIPHFEQIVAASYEDGITVAEMVPGKVLYDVSEEDMKCITEDQLSDLLDATETALNRGIRIDQNPGNILYDPNAGFGIIDYHSVGSLVRQDFGDIVDWLAIQIIKSGFYDYYNPRMTEGDYMDYSNHLRANLTVLDKYKKVIGGKLTGKGRDLAFEKIEKRVVPYQEIADKYSEPEWVKAKISTFEENRRLLRKKYKDAISVK
jgi:hypothetical protein